MSKSILGIDIAKETFDVILLVSGQAQHASFDNSPHGFTRLNKWLKKKQAGLVHACLEATGRYGEALAEHLHEAGHEVSVVNPARIKSYAQSQLKRNKTDRLDAHLIADFCRTQSPALWTPPPPAVRELQQMVRYLDALQSMRQQERNRLSSGLTDEVVIVSLTNHIAFLDQQIDDLQQQIQDHIDRHPDLKQQKDLLTSIPGIGDLTASKLLAEIRDIHAFEDVRQLVAFAGLNPRQHCSGSSVRGRSRLSKTGSASLRHALYFPAIVACTHNPVIRAFCQRLADRGKVPMVIIGAAMRKLLHIVYGVLKSGQPFDPSLATGFEAAP